MPSKPRSPRPRRPAAKAQLQGLVIGALRDAKAAGEYPPTVRALFARVVSAGADWQDALQIIPDPKLLIEKLGLAPLKTTGTVFAKDLDAPVALPEDQPQLIRSEWLLAHLADRVRLARSGRKPSKKPPKATITAFLKDAKLSGKGLKPFAESLARHLDTLLNAQRRDGTRLPAWLNGLIALDADATAALLVRIVEEASSVRSNRPYPVPESALRAVAGATEVIGGPADKGVFFSKVTAVRTSAAGAEERCYVLTVDLPKVALIHLGDALDVLARSSPEKTELFSAADVARHLVDQPGLKRRSASPAAGTATKAGSKAKPPAAAKIVADAIEAAASRRAIPPDIAWLLDGGTRRYFLSAKMAQSDLQAVPQPRITENHRPPSAFKATGFREAFDRAFRDLTATSGGRQIVLMRDLRRVLSDFSREQFDEGLAQLWGRSYSLETVGDKRALSPADVEAAIVRSGVEYVYVVRR